MPIYEYVCKECGHKFETLALEPKCPQCGSKDLERKFSTFSYRLGNYFQNLKDEGLD